jgi:phytoene dehydrogenase-like protein
MHVAVLASGLSGLTAAGLLARKGHRVKLYEQHPQIGGVTSGIEQDGFRWDLGQMLVLDLGPGEPGRSVLEEVGISDQVEVIRGCRGNVFPDFSILRPHICSGPYWRRDYLKETFPEDAEGLDRYYEVCGVTGAMTGAQRVVGMMTRRRGFRDA